MNKKTPANNPQHSGSNTVARTVAVTGAVCGVVSIGLLLRWLKISADAAHEAALARPINGANNGGSFELWFVYWSFCNLEFLIPALCIVWGVFGVVGLSGLSALPRSKSDIVLKPDVLAEKAPANNISHDLRRLLLSLSAAGILFWVVVSFITGDPLWFLQML